MHHKTFNDTDEQLELSKGSNPGSIKKILRILSSLNLFTKAILHHYKYH